MVYFDDRFLVRFHMLPVNWSNKIFIICSKLQFTPEYKLQFGSHLKVTITDVTRVFFIVTSLSSLFEMSTWSENVRLIVIFGIVWQPHKNSVTLTSHCASIYMFARIRRMSIGFRQCELICADSNCMCARIPSNRTHKLFPSSLSYSFQPMHCRRMINNFKVRILIKMLWILLLGVSRLLLGVSVV